MKYLLIYPPVESTSAGKKAIIKISMAPPLGLLYIARVLEEDGNSVEVIDFNVENIDLKRLKQSVVKADVIGISILTISVQIAKKLIRQIKEIAPGKPVIIGGPHCSLFPMQSLLELNADVCVEGDGEHVINDITKALEEKKSLSDIHGVYYKNDKGEISNGPPATIIKDLDSMLFPARHLVKKYRYGQLIKPKLQEGKFTSIITSRGCPYKCRYCTRHFLGMNKCRFRSVENIIEELKELQREGCECVVITDDSFLSDAERAYRIMDAIIKENLHFEFFIQGARVDSADEELYKKMKDAGVRSIGFGLESGNQDVLDFYDKRITLEDIRKAVDLSRKMGFFTLGSFIFGAPFETEKHFENTARFAYSLPLDAVTFFPLEYRAGSDLWNDAVKNGKIKPDEYIVRSDKKRGLSLFSNEEITDYCKKAQRKFYLRPSHLIDEVIQAIMKKDFTFIRAGFNLLRFI